MKRIISSIFIIFYSILLQALLLKLFPNPGPGAMGTGLITFLASLALAILNFFLVKKVNGPWKRSLYFLILFIGFGIFSVYLFPQEEPFKQVSLAYELYKNKGKIKYDDLFKLNYQTDAIYVTAALVKFHDTIPDQAYRIRYCCDPSEEFYIAKYGNKYISNNDSLLIDTDSKLDTVIFRDTFNGEIVEFISPHDIFGNLTGWGHYIDDSSRKSTISYSKCKLEPIEGFNKIYYDFLK